MLAVGSATVVVAGAVVVGATVVVAGAVVVGATVVVAGAVVVGATVVVAGAVVVGVPQTEHAPTKVARPVVLGSLTTASLTLPK